MSKDAKKPFRQSMAEWRQFIYNPNSGEFLGRTAKSWGKGCKAEGSRGGRDRTSPSEPPPKAKGSGDEAECGQGKGGGSGRAPRGRGESGGAGAR